MKFFIKTIILAAGKGTRLFPLTQDIPKSLLDIGSGKSLLEESIEQMQNAEVIKEFCIITGHKKEQIDTKIELWRKSGIKVSSIFNPFYEISNNLVSLWMAKPLMNQDFIVINGDNIFTSDVLSGLIKQNKNGIFLTVCKRDRYGSYDMKVRLNSRDEVIEVSKSITSEKADAESVGLALISGTEYQELFKENLDELSQSKEFLTSYWLEVFNLMIKKGIPIHSFEIDCHKWDELDSEDDLNELKKQYQKGKN